MPAHIDTLAFTRTLEGAGMDRKTSEALATAINDIAMQDVATKADLEKLAHTLTIRGIAGLVAAVGFLSALNLLH